MRRCNNPPFGRNRGSSRRRVSGSLRGERQPHGPDALSIEAREYQVKIRPTRFAQDEPSESYPYAQCHLGRQMLEAPTRTI